MEKEFNFINGNCFVNLREKESQKELRITLTTLAEFLKDNPFGDNTFLCNEDFYEILTDEGYKNFSGVVKSERPLMMFRIESNYSKILEAACQVKLFSSYVDRYNKTFEIGDSKIVKNLVTNNKTDIENIRKIKLLKDRYDCYNIIGIEETNTFYCNNILVMSY